MYNYNAEILRVIDGDTYVVRVDLGWNVRIDGHIRLLGVNAPEKNTPEGIAAILFVDDLLDKLGENITLTTYKLDPAMTFARYLANITLSNGESLANLLISSGNGVRL